MMSQTFDLLFRVESTPSPSSPSPHPSHHHTASSSQSAYKKEKTRKKQTKDNNSEAKTESRTTAGEGQERGEWNGCVGWLRIRSKKALLIEIRRIMILEKDTEKDQTNPIARCLVAWLPGLRTTGQCQSPSRPLTLHRCCTSHDLVMLSVFFSLLFSFVCSLCVFFLS